jgi:hypothetical protein
MKLLSKKNTIIRKYVPESIMGRLFVRHSIVIDDADVSLEHEHHDAIMPMCL